MKLPQLPNLRSKTWAYYLLSFLFPAFCMLCVMIGGGFTPFGNSSMLYSDQYHQYYPFLVEFRKALLSGDSLLHSWNVGMGMDYLGLIAYYLASPLYLLSVFVPEGWLLPYFSLLTPVRLGLAGLFFAIFLSKIFKKNDISIVLFGAFYALCAWALGYMWNVMWMDTFALLPLVMLGMVSLLRDKKFVLYTIALFLSVYSNYYIGLFTCIFVFLTFFCYEICRWAGFKRFFCDLARIALFSVIAIGMTAILELPALAALQTTQSSNNTFPEGFKLNIADKNTWEGLLDAMRQVAGNMNGALEPSFKEGLPNLYCGIISTIFAFLFLTCKEVRIRDKICCVVLLLFFNISFIVRQLDYIWHGFHFTNMIPYRFSFLYSFVLLYMAYRAYLLRNTFKLWQVLVAGSLAIGIAFCVNDLTDVTYWAYNGALLLLYLAVILLSLPYKKCSNPNAKEIAENATSPETASTEGENAVLEEPEPTLVSSRISPWNHFLSAPGFRIRAGGLLLSCIMVMELILNIVNFCSYFGGTSIISYPRGTTASASMIRYMKEREADNLFYRAEVTHSQTLNDGALNGYNGISTFTSSANVAVTEFIQSLGYGAKNTYNRYCYEEASPLSNLFLGLKYMLARDGKVEENAYFDVIHKYNSVYLLENNAYLPLGFLAENGLADVNFSSISDHFVFQNNLLSAASGIEADYWKRIQEGLTITGGGVTIKSQTKNGYCSYSTSASGAGTVTYTYTIQDEGFMCIYLTLPKKNKCSIWLNGKELYSETYSLPQMMSVSDVKPGDTVQLKLTCKAAEASTMNIRAAILQEAPFRAAYDVLNTSTLELTEFSNAYIKGTIHCNRDGLLYTSIPQNGNWFAYVDGEKVETKLVGNAMVAIDLTEGIHTVVFKYENAAFSLGWKVSLVSFLLAACLYLLYYKPFKQKPFLK